MRGKSLTDIKNEILAKLIDNLDIVKALVIDTENFKESIPTALQQNLIDNPDKLIRTQIYPYKKIYLKEDNFMSYITTSFVDFRKIGTQYKNGTVYFYVIIPTGIEKTNYGIRYDFICDRIEELFSDSGIGRFEFNDRGDFDISGNYIGHYISFNITDFRG